MMSSWAYWLEASEKGKIQMGKMPACSAYGCIRELHSNGDNGNTVVICGNTAVVGTNWNIFPRSGGSGDRRDGSIAVMGMNIMVLPWKREWA